MPWLQVYRAPGKASCQKGTAKHSRVEPSTAQAQPRRSQAQARNSPGIIMHSRAWARAIWRRFCIVKRDDLLAQVDFVLASVSFRITQRFRDDFVLENVTNRSPRSPESILFNFVLVFAVFRNTQRFLQFRNDFVLENVTNRSPRSPESILFHFALVFVAFRNTQRFLQFQNDFVLGNVTNRSTESIWY